MNDFIHLTGGEEVSRAASQMKQAAGDMQRAADSIEHTLFQFSQRMEDWISRLERLVPVEQGEEDEQ